MWGFFADKAGIDEQTGALPPEQFDHISEEHVLENGGAGFGRVVQPTIQAIVELVDVDGDGRLSVEEPVQAVRAYHLGEIDVPLLGR
ncbi:EF-hand domain-containing protein [Streptomyces omiyaensis]|uniref:EF-hand domain-containing protein n=1 Tax=Streptomyces omiyaensis TaxID=68247 RepID=A0ABW7BZB9_9ACTN|nr:hypothetical protein [Streptomyces omiyaensis]GGY64794.1 hypothetical protein GCM10010363_52730 [Streptomyces omiyaensis]